jgi:uncharacterized SAM-binding protein YcdF (DUF218 family)
VLLAAPLALSAVLLTFVPFVWPGNDVPSRADAVIVLSGDHGERRPAAFRAVDRGVAPTLVFNGTPDFGDEDQLCHDGWKGHEVVCLRPQPDGTRQEARAAARLAEDRGWHSVIVVTTSYHAVRAGLLFDRCVDGHVYVLPVRRPAPLATTVKQVVREWLGTVYFGVLSRGC